MVTKRVRSEYMNNFKDPKWETFSKCYEEMLTYRLTRRLLEHTHNPWFWSGSDSDSDSAGRSPRPPGKNQVVAESSRAGAEPEQNTPQANRTTEAVTRLQIQDEEEDASALHAAAHGSQSHGTKESEALPGAEEEQRVCNRASKWFSHPLRDKVTGRTQPQKTKPSKSSKQTWRSQRVRPAPFQPPREDVKESHRPFALYGSGEKDADVASRKTHNVGAAASTAEIHESALRAKTRREVERQIQTQRSERRAKSTDQSQSQRSERKAKSADQDKARKLVPADFNPWLTEYMRCFSARIR